MNKLPFSYLIAVICTPLLPSCLSNCGRAPYQYDRAFEEAEIFGTFNRLGTFEGHPEIPRQTAVSCPESVKVIDGKASFICTVAYNNGTIQKFRIEVDNGSRSLRNAN